MYNNYYNRKYRQITIPVTPTPQEFIKTLREEAKKEAKNQENKEKR